MKFLFRHVVTSLVLVSFMTTFSICQAKEYMPREAFDEDQWNYIKQEFKTKIDDCNHKNIQKALKYIVSISGAGVGLKGTKYIFFRMAMLPFAWFSLEVGEFIVYMKENNILPLLMAAGGFAVSYKMMQWIKKYIKHSVASNVLKEFLDKWQENKPYTPEELHETFEQLKENYEAKGADWLRTVSYAVVKEIRRKHILA